MYFSVCFNLRGVFVRLCDTVRHRTRRAHQRTDAEGGAHAGQTYQHRYQRIHNHREDDKEFPV